MGPDPALLLADVADPSLRQAVDCGERWIRAALCAIAHPSQDRLGGAEQQWLTEVAELRVAQGVTSLEPLGERVVARERVVAAVELQERILRSEELPDLHDGVQDRGYQEPQVDAFDGPDLW